MDLEDDFSQYLEEVDEDFYNQRNSQDNDDSSEPYIECLKKSFGHSNFRPMQWKIISSILDLKQDNCSIMATGYGKSLCYQFPSVFLDTVTLVVSPLISLMEDQVLSLTMSNIKACYLGSAQKDKTVIDRVLNFEYNLVYLTPELITSDFGENILKTLRKKLTLIAIDEAHCVSQWGHDFRTAFRSLGKIRDLISEVPILAMTATATDRVKNDIIRCLALRNPQITCTGFDRPNLEFNSRLKGGQGIWADLGIILQTVRTGSRIIYCITRKQTEEVAEVLTLHGVQCKAYHAGLTINQRKDVHEQFVRDSIQTIVATIAFGMGIDKPDVRLVIHYGASKDLESYYQEVGRAGRDGLPAKCIMLYSRADFTTHQFMREKTTKSQEMLKNLELLSNKMRDYINTTDCRRLFILRYFEGPNAKCSDQRKNCCDNCRSNSGGEKMSSIYEDLDDNGYADFTKDSLHLLKAISAFNGTTGLGIPLLLLRGSKDQKLGKKYYEHEVYGAGKAKSEDYYKSLALLLEDNKYLRKEQIQSKFVKTFQKMQRILITDKGSNWISNPSRSNMKLKPSKDMFKYLKKKKSSFLTQQATSTNSTYNPNLGDNLRNTANSTQNLLRSLFKIRITLANKENVMPYIIASNKALIQLAQRQPLNLEQIKKENLDGFSEAKVTKFGPQFLKCILQFKNFLPPDNNEKKDDGSLVNILSLHPVVGAKASESHFSTYDLWNCGKGIAEIAQLRGMAEGTISGHLSELIKSGHCCTKSQIHRMGVNNQNFNLILSKIPSNSFGVKLTEIKNHCPPNITFDMIKYVLSYQQVREHLQNLNINFPDPDQKKEILSNTFIKSALDNETTSNTTSLCTKGPVTAKNIVTKPTNRNDENLWESDTEIDFNEIDDAIGRANLSISDELNITRGSSTLSKNDSGELDLLVADINKNKTEEDEEKSVGNRLASNQERRAGNKLTSNPLKRRLAPKQSIIYEDSSDDENEASPQKTRKRIMPGWLPNAKVVEKEKKKVNKSNIF